MMNSYEGRAALWSAIGRTFCIRLSHSFLSASDNLGHCHRRCRAPRRGAIVTFYWGSEDLCLLRWQNLKTCQTWCFGYDIPNGTTRCSVFAKEFTDFVPNAISHYGRPSRFALICFNARRLDDSASLLVPHNLESWISHPKESELHLSV